MLGVVAVAPPTARCLVPPPALVVLLWGIHVLDDVVRKKNERVAAVVTRREASVHGPA